MRRMKAFSCLDAFPWVILLAQELHSSTQNHTITQKGVMLRGECKDGSRTAMSALATIAKPIPNHVIASYSGRVGEYAE